MAWSDTLTEIFKFINNFFITPRKQIEKVVKIYDILHKILNETEVQRVIIYKLHNGGGIIKPSGEIFISALYEDYTTPFETIKDRFQKLPVDKEYAKFVMELMESKKLYLKTENQPNGLLKDLLISGGVTNSIAYYLGSDKKNIYFCFCETMWSENWMTKPEEFVTIDVSMNMVKQLIK